MKTYILSLFFFLLISNVGYSQSNFLDKSEFGIKGGANSTNMIYGNKGLSKYMSMVSMTIFLLEQSY